MKALKPWAILWPEAVKSPKIRALRFSTREQAEGAAQISICNFTEDRTMRSSNVFGVVYNEEKKDA